MLFFSFSTFTENVEMLAYMMWPGFVMVGIAVGERVFNPFRFPMKPPEISAFSDLSAVETTRRGM